jgi:hypothetical protein
VLGCESVKAERSDHVLSLDQGERRCSVASRTNSLRTRSQGPEGLCSKRSARVDHPVWQRPASGESRGKRIPHSLDCVPSPDTAERESRRDGPSGKLGKPIPTICFLPVVKQAGAPFSPPASRLRPEKSACHRRTPLSHRPLLHRSVPWPTRRWRLRERPATRVARNRSAGRRSMGAASRPSEARPCMSEPVPSWPPEPSVAPGAPRACAAGAARGGWDGPGPVPRRGGRPDSCRSGGGTSSPRACRRDTPGHAGSVAFPGAGRPVAGW